MLKNAYLGSQIMYVHILLIFQLNIVLNNLTLTKGETDKQTERETKTESKTKKTALKKIINNIF